MARLVSLAVLLALIVGLGIMFFQVIAPFLLPLFLAGMLAILCQPIFCRILEKTGQRRQWAAGLTTFGVLAVVLVPILVGTVIASIQLYQFARRQLRERDWDETFTHIRMDIVEPSLTRLQDYLPEGMGPSDIDLPQLQEQIKTNASAMLQGLAERTVGFVASTLGVLGTFVSLMIATLMFVIALYYFLADGPALLAASEELIPVQIAYQRELRDQFARAVRAVMLATFLAALGQGFATAVILFLAGTGHFFTFFILSTLTAMIPLLGTWLVWGPCAIWLGYHGHWGAASFVAVAGLLVVGLLDNVIRTYVLHSDVKLHPLLAFVTVLGALQVMGLWGVFIGPIIASCLHALIKIFNTELRQFSKERFAAADVPTSVLPQVEETFADELSGHTGKQGVNGGPGPSAFSSGAGVPPVMEVVEQDHRRDAGATAVGGTPRPPKRKRKSKR